MSCCEGGGKGLDLFAVVLYRWSRGARDEYEAGKNNTVGHHAFMHHAVAGKRSDAVVPLRFERASDVHLTVVLGG